jgi:hypothetical protein
MVSSDAPDPARSRLEPTSELPRPLPPLLVRLHRRRRLGRRRRCRRRSRAHRARRTPRRDGVVADADRRHDPAGRLDLARLAQERTLRSESPARSRSAGIRQSRTPHRARCFTKPKPRLPGGLEESHRNLLTGGRGGRGRSRARVPAGSPFPTPVNESLRSAKPVPRNGAAQESNLPSRGLHDLTGFEDSRESA